MFKNRFHYLQTFQIPVPLFLLARISAVRPLPFTFQVFHIQRKILKHSHETLPRHSQTQTEVLHYLHQFRIARPRLQARSVFCLFLTYHRVTTFYKHKIPGPPHFPSSIARCDSISRTLCWS